MRGCVMAFIRSLYMDHFTPNWTSRLETVLHMNTKTSENTTHLKLYKNSVSRNRVIAKLKFCISENFGK